LWSFVTSLFFTVRSWKPHMQPPSWRIAPHQLSATVYSIYSQLPSISGGCLLHPQPEDVPCRGDKGPWLQTGYGLDNWIIDHLYTPLRTTHNYSTTANLHTLQITTALAKLCSLQCLIQPFPGNCFYQWRFFSFLCSGSIFRTLVKLSTHLNLPCWAQLHCQPSAELIAISSQLSSTANSQLPLKYNHFAWTE
jgi:hypothetical protein